MGGHLSGGLMIGARSGIRRPALRPTPPAVGLTGRVRADSISQADNSAVATWPGLAGGDATQATGGNRPIYKASGIGSKPSVQFTRANAHYLIWAGVDPSITVFTWLVVFQPDAAMPSGEQDLLTGTTGGPDSNPYLSFDGSASYGFTLDNAGWGNLLLKGGVWSNLNKRAIMVTFDKANAGSCKMYRSGTDVGATVSNLGTAFTSGRQTIIGGWPLRNSNYFNGQLAEIAKWNRILTPTEIATTFDYTLERYGV